MLSIYWDHTAHLYIHMLQVLVFRREGWASAEEYCCRAANQLQEHHRKGDAHWEDGLRQRKAFVKTIMVQVLEVDSGPAQDGLSIFEEAF